ncbi:hypothetical protein FXO37_36210, partial [Capsicum annuum]
VSYIISWNFAKGEQHRIKYLSKEIRVKGWTPKPAASKTLDKEKSAATSSTSASHSKKALKEKLKKALQDMESLDANEEEILQLLDEASSTGSSDNNGDMLNPKGIAMAYLDPY